MIVAPVARGRVQLFDNRNDMGNVHCFATGSGLSGGPVRPQCEHIPVAVQIVIVEFANVHKKRNALGNPRFGVHEPAMVGYFSVVYGLNLGFHCVFGVDCVCHNVWNLWPGLPRAGV